MVVQTFEITPGHAGLMGLDVGAANVRDYFPREIEMIELELDHLRIVCALTPSFWEGRPEIYDARLSTWLEAKRMGGKLTATPAPLAMIPTGQHLFRLEVIARDAADYALTSAPNPSSEPLPVFDGPVPVIAPAIASGIVPILAYDRRKRSLGHEPERRRVGKLMDNDSPTPAASH